MNFFYFFIFFAAENIAALLSGPGAEEMRLSHVQYSITKHSISLHRRGPALEPRRGCWRSLKSEKLFAAKVKSSTSCSARSGGVVFVFLNAVVFVPQTYVLAFLHVATDAACSAPESS